VRARRGGGVLLGAAMAVLLSAGVGSASAAAARDSVHLGGTAYEFNKVEKLLGGATIRVAEDSRLHATVHADGTYDLAVPARATITPYIVAAGYHTIYLQTFRTAGADLANVNFQTPSIAVYQALVALLAVPLDAAGDPAACAIVSTFNTRDVRDRDYAGFIGYGPHGVPGATATATPALPPPIYFNAAVIPDPAQVLSSPDGGVVWTGVPAGVYTISAHHPTSRFASFVATCQPGRVVNANPPWGLHELGLANPATIAATWSRRGSQTMLRSLTARRLPKGATVRVRCTGTPRCPVTARTVRPAGTSVNLRARLGTAATRLRAGQTLEVTVTAHRYDGRVTRWRIGSATPRRTRLCLPLGDTAPRARC
jgi:hypothetical protein